MSGEARDPLAPATTAEEVGRTVVARALASPMAFPLVVAVASRIYSSALLFIADHYRTVTSYLTNERSPFVTWDTQWYLQIARYGYHPWAIQVGPNGGRHDFAFFPGWPGVMRALDLLGLPLGPAAAIAANVLAIAALVVIFGVLERHFGRQAARGGLLLLAFGPASFVLSMAYSEQLFLLAAGLYFASAGRRWQPWIAAATMFVRVTGLAILASAVVAWVRNPREARPLLAAAAVATVFGGWWVYLWALTGNPTAWLNGSPNWFDSLGPWAIADGLQAPTPEVVARIAITVAMLVGALFLTRRNAELGVYCLAAITMTVLGAPLASMPRHTLVAFPVFGYLALRLGQRPTYALAIALAVMQVWFVGLTFTGTAPVPP